MTKYSQQEMDDAREMLLSYPQTNRDEQEARHMPNETTIYVFDHAAGFQWRYDVEPIMAERDTYAACG